MLPRSARVDEIIETGGEKDNDDSCDAKDYSLIVSPLVRGRQVHVVQDVCSYIVVMSGHIISEQE